VSEKQWIAMDRDGALPVCDRILDRLADILFASDDILGMIDGSARARDDRTAAVVRSVQGVYDEVNELMKQLTH
jgi:hypothetical protein